MEVEALNEITLGITKMFVFAGIVPLFLIIVRKFLRF